MEENNEKASSRLEELDNKVDYLMDQIHVWKSKLNVVVKDFEPNCVDWS